MMHPQIFASLVEMHHKELRQDRAKNQMQYTRRVGKPGLQERFAMRAGAVLIAAGRRLQAPYEAALGQQSEAYRSGC